MKHNKPRFTEEQESRQQALEEIRFKHGFSTTGRPKNWSKGILEKQNLAGLPAQQKNVWPKNAPLLDALQEKFGFMGFSWKTMITITPNSVLKGRSKRTFKDIQYKEETDRGKIIRFFKERDGEWQTIENDDRISRGIYYENYPQVAGHAPTLIDLFLAPLELIDDFSKKAADAKKLELVGKQAVDFEPMRRRMEETGIAYKGLDGVSWLPGLDTLALPAYVGEMAEKVAQAVFLLYDAVGKLYGKDTALTEMLGYLAPDRITKLCGSGRVDIIRPDMVVVKDRETGLLRPVITELESAPAGHGMLHAMQSGYELPPIMVDTFIEYLAGRRYVVYSTNEWAEYVFDQAAFCKALRERGVDARIIFDAPLENIHKRVACEWLVPDQADERIKKIWSKDFLGRIQNLGFADFISGSEEIPESMGDTVVFRFGYFDNYPSAAVEQMILWQNQGTTVINPPWFCLESKVLMAAVWLTAVRDWMNERDPEAIPLLERCLAETRLLTDEMDLQNYIDDRPFWISKYAAWDGKNQSWGSRSLEVGAQLSSEAWKKMLEERQKLEHPVVLQHMISSHRVNHLYVDHNGLIQYHSDCRTRLTPFFLRMADGKAQHCGSMITLRPSVRVHGATDALEAPVVYMDMPKAAKDKGSNVSAVVGTEKQCA